MGANLSKNSVIATSDITLDVISPGDMGTIVRLTIMWAASFYVMLMIWSTTLLADRWRGPKGDKRISGASVLAAIIMSTAWPVVVGYLMVSS